MRMQSKICTFVLGAFLSVSATAEVIWSSFSLSGLRGSNYEVVEETQRVLTVEYAAGLNWGDSFFFLDHLTSETHSDSQYFELSPRFSLSYLTSSELSLGPITDFYVATTWEGGDAFNNYLVGLGTSFNIPGFRYFTINLYNANNDLWDNDEQLTFTWGVPFGSGKWQFLYDGFLDYSTESDTNAAEMNFTSQLKWNVGALMNLKSPLYVGMEYAYWTNKFGIDGVDEKNPCLLLKWHF